MIFIEETMLWNFITLGLLLLFIIVKVLSNYSYPAYMHSFGVFFGSEDENQQDVIMMRLGFF